MFFSSDTDRYSKLAMDMSDEQRRFVRVPVDTIQSCVDRVDVQASDEVSSGLAEDVSFRIRQIAESACQFMHHSKRRRLTLDDMEKAMKYSGLEPLYGHHSELPHQYGDIVLEHVTSAPNLADDHTLPNHTPLVTAGWQVVEGVEPEDGEGTVQLPQQNPSESQKRFLSLLLEAVTGEDEDKRRVALATVQSKPCVASILPSLVHYLQQTLSNWEQFTPAQLRRVLKLSLAVFKNTGLFLDPYSSSVYPLLKDVLFSPRYLSVEGEVKHWHVRLMAAATMAQLLKRCASPLNVYTQELLSHFQQLFGHPQQSSLPVLYGALSVLCCLGYGSLVEVLFPHLEALVDFFNGSLESNVKNDVFRLQETILVAAQILLTSDERTPSWKLSLPDVTRTQRRSPSSGAEVSNIAGSRSGPTGGEATLFGSAATLGFSGVDGGGAGTLEGEPSPSHIDPSPSSPLTLYDYLADVIGEGLSLSLSVPTHNGEPGTPLNPYPSKTSPENLKVDGSKRTTRSLEAFLSGEGFRPIRIQLPQRPPPPPSIPRGYYKGREPWTFGLPQSVLPIGGNILEQKDRDKRRSKRGGRGIPQEPRHDKDRQGVVKGACPGQRRRCRLGQHLQQCPVNMGSLWI